jgi:hypothetical protein
MATVKQTRELSDKIVEMFINKKFKEGLALAKPHWPLPEVEIDGMANQIETQWPIVDQRFGKSTGYEQVREEKIGNSFIRYFYLHKFQNHAIYWQFTYYKPADTWKVNGVQFLDSLDVLYETTK